jgi:hypothetical protein
MGQRIEIESNRVVDKSVIVTTNRNFTGTDGEGYNSTEQATIVDSFGAKLAVDLFESDEEIGRVFVSSNVVIIEKEDGWSEAAAESAGSVISDFFLYY